MPSLTIGQTAKQAGVGVETLRFYERQGLIPEPERLPSGYRQYGLETVRRVRFIRQAKTLGFTLKEIRELLELRVNPKSTCADIKRRAQAKITDIEERIRSLGRMKAALSRLECRCHGSGPTSECPILDELDRKGVCDASD